MIVQEHGEQTLQCDECGDLLDLSGARPGFHGMIEHAKNVRWAVKPDGSGGWTHTCPVCGVDTGGLAAQRKLLGL